MRDHARLWRKFWRFPIAIRRGVRLSRARGVSHGDLLTDEEEVSEPVARFCIQRGCLESAAVVGLGLKETTASARTSGVSTRSALCDALVDACKEEVGKDGGVGALAEESGDDGAGELACEMVLKEEMDLGDPGGHCCWKSGLGRWARGYLDLGGLELKKGLGSRMLRHTRSH